MRQGLKLTVPDEEPIGSLLAADFGLNPIVPDEDARIRYAGLTAMLERLHRRYLDVVRLGLESIGVNDINATQALILMNVGEGEVPIRDLVQRGYYLVSSASYNIKKLVDYGYLEQVRSVHDRRSVRLRLGEPGRQVVEHLQDLDLRLVDIAAEEPELLDALDQATRTLRKIERVWAEFINFG